MDATSYLRFVLVLILVIGLILGLAWALRRFGAMNRGPLGRRRLRTVEFAALDARHRVVLIRRDNVEHLLLIGPNTSQVIERGIPAAEAPDSASPLPNFSQFLTRGSQG